MRLLRTWHLSRVSILMLSLFALGATPAMAKPISYPGGTMLMVENDETGNTASLDYTFSRRAAAALYVKKETNGREFTMVGPQINYLVKRWNLPYGQGNIFSMTGAGTALAGGKARFTAWTTILADYETRRIFTSYEARFMYAAGMETSLWQRARAGFAPYLANYNDLNTWFMVQVDHHPEKNHATAVTPLVRLFYKTLLVEGGVSTRGTVMFNLVKQF
jgi:hypothetical protein